MHLGVARTSLAAWLDARKAGGRILLRIEDVDEARVVPGAAEGLVEDLRWLGLDFDGPITTQSQRYPRYEAAIAQLAAQGRVYPCTCSRREIALASAPHGPEDDGPRYPGTCREAAQPKEGRRPALRLRTEPGDRVEFRDVVFGAFAEDVHQRVGDFVLQRSDGLWAYQLAVSVDDLEQGVTRVVRGSDLLASTARQSLLRRLLDPCAPPLETLHVALVRGADGARLAKRHGSPTVAERRARGHSPQSVVGLLATSLGLIPAGNSSNPQDLLPLWDPSRLSQDDTVLKEAAGG